MAMLPAPAQFPAGLRVLAVDDNIVWLKVLKQMLQRCAYKVTTADGAATALDLLRKNKGFFDLVLSDVHMPEMDGFKFLELVGMEMDLPVIMMSVDDSTSTVLKGVRYGASDFLVKPVREEELKNIWQHVVRKMWNGNKEYEKSATVDENDKRHNKRRSNDVDYSSSVSEGSDVGTKSHKKKQDAKDEYDHELENDEPATSKKPRVVWSMELHKQFVCAVNHLGIDKAVPKRILELMNVPGLTRENVASHLQKFRQYVKRLSRLAQEHHIRIPTSLCDPIDQNPELNSRGRFSIRALAAAAHLPSETLATLQTEFFGHLPLLQATLQGPECNSPLDPHVSYGPSLTKFLSNKISKPSISIEDVRSGLMWPPNSFDSVEQGCSISGLGDQSKLPHQQQQRPKQLIVPDPSPLVNVQPSCVVGPSHSSASFQSGNSPGLFCHNHGLHPNPVNPVIDYNLLSSQPSSVFVGRDCGSSSVSSCSVNADSGSGTGLVVQDATPAFSVSRQVPHQLPMITSVQGSCSGSSSQVVDQGQLSDLGFVHKGMKSIPSRFAVDEIEFPVSNLNQQKSCGEESSVKPEANVDHIDHVIMGSSIFQPSPNDFMTHGCFF